MPRKRKQSSIKLNAIHCGDCRDLIPLLPDRSIDLCLTSPPYTEMRKHDYPSVPEREYSEFTICWMEELASKLKTNGSVLINLDANIRNGVMSDYVLKLQLALREAGWNQHRTQIWNKGGLPLARHDWPRHSYEEILWFSKTNSPFCNPRSAGEFSKRIPIKDAEGSKWQDRKDNVTSGIARVSDIIKVSVGENEPNVDHPARYPVRLAERLIKTFSPDSGTVLDPFAGSGTTLIAAKKLNRVYCGFDVVAAYAQLARERISNQSF